MDFIKCLNENQGAVMAALTFVYVATTIVIAFLSLKATKLSQKNIDTLAELEKNRVRPFVVFNISSSIPTRTTCASVKNLGLTAAHNVKITISPKLGCLRNGEEFESALTAHNILFLAAHDEVNDVIDSSPSFYEKYPEPFFEGCVEYEDAESNKYKEQFRLDLTFLMKRIYVGEPSVTNELKEINESLKSIVNKLETRHD